MNKLKKIILKITQEHTNTINELKELKENMAASKNLTNNNDANQSKLIDYESAISSLKNELKQKNKQIESLLNETQALSSQETALQEGIAKSNIVISEKDSEIQQLKEEADVSQKSINERENS